MHEGVDEGVVGRCLRWGFHAALSSAREMRAGQRRVEVRSVYGEYLERMLVVPCLVKRPHMVDSWVRDYMLA